MREFALLVGLGREESKRAQLKAIAAHGTPLCVISNAHIREAPWNDPLLLQSAMLYADFHDLPKVVETVEAYSRENGSRLVGVLTYLEETVLLAQRLQTHFGLAQITSGDPRALRHKGMMRAAFGLEGVRQPRYACCSSEEEYWEALRDIGFPAIVKPAELLGSIGVSKVSAQNDRSTVLAAFNTAKAADRPDERFRQAFTVSTDVLVESYVPAEREVSVEGYVYHGRFTSLCITEKYLGGHSGFHEVGHLTPSPFISAGLRASLEGEVEAAVRALALRNSAVHAELRIDRGVPYFVELGSRLGGDQIPVLVDKALSYSFPSAALMLALNTKPKAPPAVSGHAGIAFFQDSAVAGEITHWPDVYEVVEYSGSGGRKGHCLWFGEDIENWQALVARLRPPGDRTDLKTQYSGDLAPSLE